MKKKIVFTRHALDRIKQRGLTREWVVDIIKTHNVALNRAPDNTQEFRKDRDGSYYFVVVEHKKSVLVVITVGECGKK